MFFVNAALNDISIGTAGLVALLGYAVVFVGLIALMAVVLVMGKIMVAKKAKTAAAAPAPAAPAPAAPAAANTSIHPLIPIYFTPLPWAARFPGAAHAPACTKLLPTQTSATSEPFPDFPQPSVFPW